MKTRTESHSEFNRGVGAAVKLLEDWNAKPNYIQSAKFFSKQVAALKLESEGPDGIGWCSSCDKITEIERPKCSCGDWLIFAADDKAGEGRGWIDCPDAQGWWWHWDCNPDHAPFIYSVMTSLSRKINREFIAYPDGRWCIEVGGKWLRIEQPTAPGEAIAEGQPLGTCADCPNTLHRRQTNCDMWTPVWNCEWCGNVAYKSEDYYDHKECCSIRLAAQIDDDPVEPQPKEGTHDTPK